MKIAPDAAWIRKPFRNPLRLLVSLAVIASQSATAMAEPAVVRGPGVSAETFQAYLEAHGKLGLADSLDLQRPGKEMDARLQRSLEKAQSAWLSGSIEVARSIFREIAKQSLEADWRESQREAIHYSLLRLAQSAPTPLERDDWLEKAALHFFDIQPEADLFPPPLLESYRASRARALATAQPYSPYKHSPEYRFLLVNGKRYEIGPDVRIRLPETTFRVTAYSDTHAPVSEKLTRQQMEVFRVSTPALVSGSCESPAVGDVVGSEGEISVLYGVGCLRTKSSRGSQNWGPVASTTGDAFFEPVNANRGSAIVFPTLDDSTSRPGLAKKHWMWIGIGVLATGAAYVAHRELTRDRGNGEIEPSHRQGF